MGIFHGRSVDATGKENMVCLLYNVDFNYAGWIFSKKKSYAVNGDNVLMLGQITTSSTQVDSGEVDMFVSLDQCHREKNTWGDFILF